jgi:uncharacterized protein YjeT (DUF2065 family)
MDRKHDGPDPQPKANRVYLCPSVVYRHLNFTAMNRLPDSRRRFFGVSLLAIIVVLVVLWALRKVPQAERKGPAPAAGETR